jgi:phospholipid/cholesterol/gamma-HCH transport system permease protein
MHNSPTRRRELSDVCRFERSVCHLTGDWSMHVLANNGEIERRRALLAKASHDMKWDLTEIERMDVLGAQLLLRSWQGRVPEHAELTPPQRSAFAFLLANRERMDIPVEPRDPWGWIVSVGNDVLKAGSNGVTMLTMFGQLVLDSFRMLRRPWYAPWRELSAQIFRTGTQALGITALVGFLIGVVLSYLSAQQLQTFGADQFIVRLLGVAIVRELGPVLAAILVAGRSGSAITAQLGVMRVTQELDAMGVMGIAHGQRLILPRVVALSITMPLLVLWTDAAALAGGSLAAYVELGMSPSHFAEALPAAVSLANYAIGLVKGVAFGGTIGLIACHFGLRIEPNTESLGRGTTTSVVTAITGVILVDAVFAVALQGVGL